MSEIIFKDLLCGFKVIVDNSPERVTSPYGTMDIPMRITHSYIHFIILPISGSFGIRNKLNPIKFKDESTRKKTIEKEITKFILNNSKTIYESYSKYVEKVCEGDCQSKICFQKPPPE